MSSLIYWVSGPRSARREVFAERSRRGSPADAKATVEACVNWLCVAQDQSVSKDDGVARHFSFRSGWSASYPETTGYIIPTLLACAVHLKRPDLEARARRMTDWLTSIQFAEGGFPGGMITEEPQVPVTFNTGQILLGLAAMAKLDPVRYNAPLDRAANWLADTIDPDGCWRKFATPFADPGEKAYETHVAWGLFSAAAGRGREDWKKAATANVDWAISKQISNGWVSSCCLLAPDAPYTHTLGYFLKGVVEAYKHTGHQRFLDAAVRTADGLMSARRADGSLPGQLNRKWKAVGSYTCLTGCSQIAQSWFDLARMTGNDAYRAAAIRINAFVRGKIVVGSSQDVDGGVKGSFPVYGPYGQFELLNWAAKFTVDSNLQEMGLNPDLPLPPAR